MRYLQGVRFLKAGALTTALTLVTHTNEEIVLGAIRLASQILQACPREAQESAVIFFKEQGSENFFTCLHECLRTFSEDAKQRMKEVS
jgi:hypothetical protein